MAGIGVQPRKIMGWVKDARSDVLERIATLCKERESTAFTGVFGPDVTLVPVPRSAPRRTDDTLWPGRSLARALHDHGLGRDVQPLLERIEAVPKAHGSSGGERPSVLTLSRSLRWRGDLGSDLERVVLVDDVVTRGTTFLSALGKIHSVLYTYISAAKTSPLRFTARVPCRGSMRRATRRASHQHRTRNRRTYW